MFRDTHTAALTEKEFRTHMKFLDYSPIIFVSAKTGQRVTNVLNLVKKAFEARQFRVSTAELNKFLEKKVSPDVVSVGKQQKFPVKYAAQVSVKPPTKYSLESIAKTSILSHKNLLIAFAGLIIINSYNSSK